MTTDTTATRLSLLARWRRKLEQHRRRLDARLRAAELHYRHCDADQLIGWLLDDYARTLRGAEPRRLDRPGGDLPDLLSVLTGLGGALLSTAHLKRVKGLVASAEAARLSGLLVLEIAGCVTAAARHTDRDQTLDYQGVQCAEWQHAGVADALMWLALAYDGWAPNPLGNPEPGPTVTERLEQLTAAVEPICPDAAVVVGELLDAHLGGGRS